MYPAYFVYIVAGIFYAINIIVGVAVVAWFLKWFQNHSQSIKSLDGGRVYVELRALAQDEAGYFIPGYGRILQTWENTDADSLRQLPEVKQWNGKVALICHDQTPATSATKQYIINNIVPL